MAPQKALDAITTDDITANGAPPDEGASLHSTLRRVLHARCLRPRHRVARGLPQPAPPELNFVVHRMMYYGCHSGSPSSTPPSWIPDMEDAVLTNVGRVLETRGERIDRINILGPNHKLSRVGQVLQ